MKGKVYLIGAGPGDPGLVTLKAIYILQSADVVVFDRLVNPALFSYIKEGAELIDVSKAPGAHSVPQEETNRILAAEARLGKQVARLKGGDPFVFGRGGEEALYLQKQNIPYEIIPGITSAISVPAYAGIPVTFRGMASSFHIITGHEMEDKEQYLNFKVLAQLSGTLVFLMGIKNIKTIAESLIKNGKSPSTPTAVIMRGTTPRQKVALGTLSDICEKVERAGIKNPSVIVVGDVANLRESLQWFETKKLWGKKILMMGIDDSYRFTRLLQEEGAHVSYFPTLKITPQKDNLKNFLRNHGASQDILVFTSKNGARVFTQEMKKQRLDARCLKNSKIWAVGPKTAEKLIEANIYPDEVPEVYTGKALLMQITERDIGKKAVVITSDIGGNELISGLKNLGLKAEKLVAYTNEANLSIEEGLLRELEEDISIAVFTSPSSYYYMREMAKEKIAKLHESAIAAIGPTTKKAIEADGYTVDIMPDEHTLSGIAQAIMEFSNFN